jgi:hypothetical protein
MLGAGLGAMAKTRDELYVAERDESQTAGGVAGGRVDGVQGGRKGWKRGRVLGSIFPHHNQHWGSFMRALLRYSP